MKKLLAMILAVVGVLTMGTSAVLAKPYTEYPYLCEDFATKDALTGLSCTANMQWSEEGAHGSVGSVYLTKTKEGQDLSFSLKDGSFLVGNKFKMSMWVKLDTSVAQLVTDENGKAVHDSAAFTFWGHAKQGDGTVTKNSWYTGWTVNNLGLNSGEWVYVEKIIDNWNGAMRHGTLVTTGEDTAFTFAARVGEVNGKVTESVGAGNKLAYWVDDFCVEPIYETAQAPEAESSVLYRQTFSTAPENVGGGTYVTEKGHDNQTGYYSVTKEKRENNFADVYFTAANKIRYNKLYKFSFWAKANDAATVGSRLQLTFLRQNRLDRTNDTGVYGNYQYRATQQNLTQQWQYYELYMKRNVKSFDETDLAVNLRCGNPTRAAEEGVKEGCEGVSFSLDDYQIEEISANGDFELLQADSVEKTQTTDGSCDSKKYGTFYGWFESGVTTSVSADKAADSTGKQSAQVTVNTAGGSVNQGVFFENNTPYTISFRAKGVGDSVGKKLQVKLDRSVNTVDVSDVYTVPDTELLGDNLTLTDKWQTYTIAYQSAFRANSTPKSGVGPRQPFLSFVVDDGAEDLTYLLDDFKIEKKLVAPKQTRPYVTDLELEYDNLIGGEAVIRYVYNSDQEIFEDKTIIRVKKQVGDNLYVVLAQLISDGTGEVTYTVPAAAEGAYLVFEVIPVAEDSGSGVTCGYISSVKTTEAVKKPFTAALSLADFNKTENSVTGTFAWSNYSGDTVNIFLAIAVYDSEGTLMYITEKPLSLADRSADKTTLTATLKTVAGASAPYRAKIFAWSGTSTQDTVMYSYADAVEKTDK